MRSSLCVIAALAAGLEACSSATAPAVLPAAPNVPVSAALAPRAALYALLHSFQSGPDGSAPRAGLVAVGSELYGTTYYGGSDGAGTIFQIDAKGAERVVYSFK